MERLIEAAWNVTMLLALILAGMFILIGIGMLLGLVGLGYGMVAG